MVDLRLMDRVNQGFRTVLQALMTCLAFVFFWPLIDDWVGGMTAGWLTIFSVGFFLFFLWMLAALFLTWLFASVFFPRPRNY